MKKQNSNIIKLNPFLSLYGAKNLSNSILKNKLGLNSRLAFSFIKQKNLNNLNNRFSKLLLGNKLKLRIKEQINFIKNIRTYRGLRHKVSLPVRGQRTHTNAKTSKKTNRQKA
jgi:small subunit ribosomal protein S13